MARTTHRSSKGTKLYAVRDAEGQFKDIQSYKRAHRQDVKRVSKAETAAKKVGKRNAAQAVVKKTPAKTKTAKKSRKEEIGQAAARAEPPVVSGARRCSASQRTTGTDTPSPTTLRALVSAAGRR